MMNRTPFLPRPTPLAAACALLLCGAAAAQTLPTGGSIVSGSGTISSSGAAMTVNQSTARMVADWQSFSIGAGASVRFVQPSASSVALNRVTGGDPSAIFGTLSANGQGFLQNPNGVLFAPGAQVDVGALVATTLQADLAEFNAGRLRLSGESRASVRNEGRLSAAPGGYVVLAGADVANAGAIDAPAGTAALAAGSAVEIDATGAGLLSIRVPVAAVAAQLSHTGTTTADGGLVSLQAAAQQAGLQTVMNVGGVVRARSVESRDGRIVLSGGTSGVVRVDGTLDASGGEGLHGGAVTVLGERVGLAGTARLDATGGSGGGTILVGGNAHGAGPEFNATDAFVGRGAVLDASATGNGQGGTVVVWSQGTTTFGGEIRARGGATGGDGGFAEVSGAGALAFDGSADLRAPAGAVGTLLLDPSFLSITATGVDITGDIDFASNVSAVTPTSVAAVLATADLLLQASFSLNVDAPVTVTTPRASTLTLNSASISINAPMTLNNVSLVADTQSSFSDGITVGAALQSLASITLRGSSIFVDDATVAAPTLTVGSGAGGNFTLSQTSLASVRAGTLAIEGSTATATVQLDSGLNQVDRLNFQGPADVRATIANAGATPLALDGLAGTLTLTTNAPLAQSAPLTLTGFSSITSTSTAASLLTDAGNTFGSTVDFLVGGAFTLNAGGPLPISASAGGPVAITTTGVLSNFGITSTGGDVVLTSAGFDNQFDGSGGIFVPAANRFVIRSSDFTADNFNGIGFGPAANDVANVVFAGWTGALPASGNTYVTNATGTLVPPTADTLSINRPYDRTTTIAWQQSGTTATGTAQQPGGGSAVLALGAYTIDTSGNFDDKNAGVDKGYTIPSTGNTTAVDLQTGANYYGLSWAGFRRDPGPLAPSAPGAVSVVTALPISITGLRGLDRVYDGTTVVQVDSSAVTQSGSFLAGDAVTLSVANATGSVATKTVGSGKAVTFANIGLTGADAGNYTLTDNSVSAVTISALALTVTGIGAADKVFDGTTTVTLDTANASILTPLPPGDQVALNAANAVGSVQTPDPGAGKTVTVSGLALTGADAGNYTLLPVPVVSGGGGLTVRILSTAQASFDEVRYTRYLEGVSDAQEPFRRAMAEALASGFGKENIRKQLNRGLVFETGLAAPAVDRIEPATPPQACTSASGLACAR